MGLLVAALSGRVPGRIADLWIDGDRRRRGVVCVAGVAAFREVSVPGACCLVRPGERRLIAGRPGISRSETRLVDVEFLSLPAPVAIVGPHAIDLNILVAILA